MGLHTAAPAAALITGIAFGDGSPETALAQHRITLGLFDPPYLAPLPALGSDGSESRRCGCAGPLPVHDERRVSAEVMDKQTPLFHTPRFPRMAARSTTPRSVRKAAREYVVLGACGHNSDEA